MKRIVVPFALCAMLTLVASDARAAGALQRFALVVGANSGGANRAQLQYAISDAEHFARVLADLGGVDPADQIVLRQPKLRELIDALDTIARRVGEARRPSTALRASRFTPLRAGPSTPLRAYRRAGTAARGRTIASGRIKKARIENTPPTHKRRPSSRRTAPTYQ